MLLVVAGVEDPEVLPPGAVLLVLPVLLLVEPLVDPLVLPDVELEELPVIGVDDVVPPPLNRPVNTKGFEVSSIAIASIMTTATATTYRIALPLSMRVLLKVAF